MAASISKIIPVIKANSVTKNCVSKFTVHGDGSTEAEYLGKKTINTTNVKPNTQDLTFIINSTDAKVAVKVDTDISFSSDNAVMFILLDFETGKVLSLRGVDKSDSGDMPIDRGQMVLIITAVQLPAGDSASVKIYTPVASSSSSDHSNTMMWVVGGVLLLIIIAVVVFLMSRNKNKAGFRHRRF